MEMLRSATINGDNMDIQNLTEREILALQYSLLEEMKHSNDNVAVISPNKEVTASLSQSFKDEKKTELLSARVKPTAKQIIENSNYSYSDAIEYFAKTLTGNEEEIEKEDVVKNYISHKYPDNEGNLENANAYLNRLRWFEMGCPPYRILAEHYGLKHGVIRKYASRFNWKEILDGAIALGFRPEIKHEVFIDKTKKVERESKEYRRFKEAVLKRDKVCQCCGSSENVEVHHALSFNQYNSLGADTNNGIVLCKECHTEYHSKYGYKKKNNPVTLAQFLRDYGMSPQSTLKEEYTVKGLSESRVMSEIVKLEEEYAGDCPYDVLLSNLIDIDDSVDSEVVKDVVTHLKQIGQIYEPNKGYYRVVV